VALGGVFLLFFRFSAVSIIPQWLSILLYLGMNNRSVGGRSSETLSPHRHGHEHKQDIFWDLAHGCNFNGCIYNEKEVVRLIYLTQYMIQGFVTHLSLSSFLLTQQSPQPKTTHGSRDTSKQARYYPPFTALNCLQPYIDHPNSFP
jgi:hypothetical protein